MCIPKSQYQKLVGRKLADEDYDNILRETTDIIGKILSKAIVYMKHLNAKTISPKIMAAALPESMYKKEEGSGNGSESLYLSKPKFNKMVKKLLQENNENIRISRDSSLMLHYATENTLMEMSTT